MKATKTNRRDGARQRPGWLARLLRDRHGSGDLTVYLLMTAAGAAIVGLTAPTLFKSSNTAAQTFQNQTDVLSRGANP